VTCKLPHKYIGLECGDIVEFDSLIQDTKMFGLDYTKENTVLGQRIYKYFIVESVKKSVSGVDVKLVQTHNLNNADVMENDPISHVGSNISVGDMTGDVNSDQLVDILDLVAIINTITVNPTDADGLNADFNEDGFVNILDVVIMVDQIIG
jgi:hypothetical protein